MPMRLGKRVAAHIRTRDRSSGKPVRVRLCVIVMLILLADLAIFAQGNFQVKAIDAYVRPYVQTQNFSGVVLVEKSGRVVFEKAYGFADREKQLPNTSATRFHIASLSMQFTAAAILHLVDQGSVSLDEHASDFVEAVAGADKITIRDLLTERSGLPDINALPNYEVVLQQHQTPATLIKAIEGKPLLFEPGSKFLHEEHSAYNLLALIIEKKTDLPFPVALDKLVFRPLGLTSSAADDDSAPSAKSLAKGYAPEGVRDLKPAKAIHWSAKAGNASVYTTADDEARWIEAWFNGHGLSAGSRETALDTTVRVGYGWFKGELKRFSKTAYYMTGRSPGFSSFVLYLPDSQTSVILLSNIYSSATTTMGYDITALLLGARYEKARFMGRALSPAQLKAFTGTFQFGPDFYQANAIVALIANGRELSLRWPSGDLSPLVPVEPDIFIDRSYWQEVKIERDGRGNPIRLVYDGFEGLPARSAKPN
jgi:CubicO group peptidase (beta-lactamase class C family)